MPSYNIVNLGSTFSKHGFDYKYFPNANGANLAKAPSPLAEDLRVLKSFLSEIKKGAIVVIVVVCPFGFCVD